jgi:hypothetical protein
MMTDIQTVRTQLHELAEWVPDLPRSWSDLPVRASRTGDGIHVRLSHTPMPGGMERAIDTWDQNGPLGIHTQIGVRQALGPWADEIRGMREALLDAHDPHDIEPWAYLHQHLDWASQHMASDQWTFMTADISGVHQRVQRLVHPDRLHEGTCPTCGARIEWILGDHGRINMPICPNHHRIDNLTGATLRRLRAADQADAPAWATAAELRSLYPDIRLRTVSEWVRRGHVRTQGSRYCLNDVAPRWEDVRRQRAS